MSHTEVARVDPDALLTPAEVASMFRVTPKTVTRWAEAGKLPVLRTLGGHRRFPAGAVFRLRTDLETLRTVDGADAGGVARGVAKLAGLAAGT